MAASSFLDSLKKYQTDNSGGDKYGGSAGKSGSGLPTGSCRNFMFATGIECSYPTIENGKIRRDELDECGHYKFWKKDFQLVKDLGIKVLRYGLPYYKIHLGPGKYDWSFADEMMNEIKRQGITPILDLLHFGLPDWLGNFQNPELPVHFADFARAIAKRYPWVRYFTPINEIYVTAEMSAKVGIWNEQLKTDTAFVTAMKHIVAASIMATQSIADVTPNALIIQSESAEYTHEAKTSPSAEVTLQNKLRFLSFDLLYAHQTDAEVYVYLMDNGMTREEYDWFMLGEPPGYQIMGNDYYGRNEKIILPDKSVIMAEDIMGWYEITRSYYERYKKPVMHTETNTFDAAQAPAWLWKQWINVLRMRKNGVPVLGFTWYSLIDQIDWDTALGQKNNTINECGLYDLQRNSRPVANAYKMLLEEYGQITIFPHGELFEVTSSDAELKVKV